MTTRTLKSSAAGFTFSGVREEDRVVAQRLYSALFRGTIPSVLCDRYFAAWDQLASDYTSDELRVTRDAILRCSDLEALELVCRRKGRLPALTAQLRLMVMLAETLPDHQKFFGQASCSWMTAATTLMFAGMRSALLYIKGSALAKRLDV